MKCTWRQCFNNALFSVHEFATGHYLNRSCGRHLTVVCLAVDGPVSLKRVPPPIDTRAGIDLPRAKGFRRHQRRRIMRAGP